MAEIGPPCGIILAGGASRRFGASKALADWGGAPMILAVARALRGRVSELLVVAKDAASFSFLEASGIRVVEDRWRDLHPAGGVCTGLEAAKSRYSFVCACDMPLIEPELVSRLWELRGDFQAVVPVSEGIPQVLCALYRSDAASALGRRIAEGRFGLVDALRELAVRRVDGRDVDPTGRSFRDIDTREDYDGARRLAGC